jgi:hypothetical protein
MKDIDLKKKKEQVINDLFEIRTVGKKGVGIKETKVIDRLFNLIDFTAVYDIKIYLHEAIDSLLSQQKEELEKKIIEVGKASFRAGWDSRSEEYHQENLDEFIDKITKNILGKVK